MAPRRASHPARATTAVADWDSYVDRSGLLTTAALLVVILAVTAARLHPNRLAQALAGPQLLLVLVVLGHVALLAYRRDPA